MSTIADTYVRARIDTETKEQASIALKAMGLTVSDVLRIVLRRVATDQAFSLELKVPNAETRAAIAELEAGKGKRFDSVNALMADLNADN